MVTRREAALAAACRAVLDNWESGDLAAAANECREALAIKSKPTRRRVAVTVRGGVVSVSWQDKGTRLTVRDETRGQIATLRTENAELVKELEALKASWRCFHCGEVFTQESDAKDHFAIEGIPPMCVDPLTKDEKARMVVVRKLEAECAKWRKENEELDHKAGTLHAMQAELSRCFGTCGGVPVKTASQAWLVHEAVLGQVEALQSEKSLLTKAVEIIRDKWVPALLRDCREADKTDCNAQSIYGVCVRAISPRQPQAEAKCVKCGYKEKTHYNEGQHTRYTCRQFQGPQPQEEGR